MCVNAVANGLRKGRGASPLVSRRLVTAMLIFAQLDTIKLYIKRSLSRRGVSITRDPDEKYSINYNSRGTSIFGRTIAD